MRQILHRRWHQIRTRQSRHNHVQDWYNYRLTEGHQLFPEYLRQIFADQNTAFKINLGFGFVLRNTETGDLQYQHTSANNHLVLDEPFLVTNASELENLIDLISNIDFIEWIKQQRPNSKWIVDWVSNVTFFVSKIRGNPIGRATYLPPFILNNKALITLECNANTGQPYNDWLCFFRCLALHNQHHPKNLREPTNAFFER